MSGSPSTAPDAGSEEAPLPEEHPPATMEISEAKPTKNEGAVAEPSSLAVAEEVALSDLTIAESAVESSSEISIAQTASAEASSTIDDVADAPASAPVDDGVAGDERTSADGNVLPVVSSASEPSAAVTSASTLTAAISTAAESNSTEAGLFSDWKFYVSGKIQEKVP
jgi:hypothetical protein